MSESPHTRTMSETSEVPLTPAEVGEPPQIKRLEDMEEFQRLTPEQQERLLALRERLQHEAMDPKAVVARNINEMGFWEGLKETVKPHLAKQKEILFKELKAGASLALSLVPVLGEGKGLGTGLFGITVNKAKTVGEGAIKFEPFVRGEKAIRAAKLGYAFSRGDTAASKLLKFEKTSGSIFTRMAMKGADIVDMAGAHTKDIFQSVKAGFGAKAAAERSFVNDFQKAAQEESKRIAEKLGVEGIHAAQQAKRVAKVEAYKKVMKQVAEKNAAGGEWYKFPLRWARSLGGEVRGRIASIKAGRVAGKAVTEAVEESLKSKNVVGRFVEGTAKRAAPTVIEATKFGKFHAFFDRWLDLTPDVPLWLSTTTGILEFFGAHGIDAIPAVLQMAHNRYKQVMISKDMALDVMKYTAMRGLRKLAERKQAAEAFSPATQIS